MSGWKKNGWKNSTGKAIINREELEELDEAQEGIQVSYVSPMPSILLRQGKGFIPRKIKCRSAKSLSLGTRGNIQKDKNWKCCFFRSKNQISRG